jgi:hypothetical protein
MIYFIIDLESGNYEGTFAFEAEALAKVRDAVTRFERSVAEPWGLGRKDAEGRVENLGEGEALIVRALAAQARI